MRITVDQDILFYAFRYALGRQTYAVGQVVDVLCDNWSELTEFTRSQILKEIAEADKKGKITSIDSFEWIKVIECENKRIEEQNKECT